MTTGTPTPTTFYPQVSTADDASLSPQAGSIIAIILSMIYLGLITAVAYLSIHGPVILS